MLQTSDSHTPQARVSFWAIGDLHYSAIAPWRTYQTQRFAPMFNDLHELWQAEGTPQFCVSPGDIIETCSAQDYALARNTLTEQLDGIPFYAGVGNHEYWGQPGEDPDWTANEFSNTWGKPLRYAWQAGESICIMLDYPNPFTLADSKQVFIAQETLAFLDSTLSAHAASPAVIFLHCPLRNTVLDRDPELHKDYNSLQYFFSPENSQEVRNILARNRNACLFISGHTHSGWEAPQLVVTESLGEHPVTFINLMSPWYTGRRTGPHMDIHTGGRIEIDGTFKYTPDDPDVVPTFAISLYQNQARIRVREHLTRQWLKEWIVPIA